MVESCPIKHIRGNKAVSEVSSRTGEKAFSERFGGSLVAARNRSGLTQEKLSELSGVGLSTIKRIEAGRAQPSLFVFFKLRSALTPDQQVALCDGAKAAYQDSVKTLG